MDDRTLLAQAGLKYNDPSGALSVPIYQSATFRHPELGVTTGYDYTRTGNPTRNTLEEEIAALEEGSGAAAFGSGMAAIGAVFQLFKAGDHLIVSEDLYGGTWRLLDQVFSNFGLSASYVDTTKPEAVSAAIIPSTKALFVETPSNPGMRISDLSALGKIAKDADLLFIVNNTFMTAYVQKPVRFGADIVVYSGTKFIAGHNDTVCGFVVSKTKDLDVRVKFIQNSYGAILSPFDSWLVLRGMKTLALRLDAQTRNAEALVAWLKKQPKVCEVLFPGLPEHPGSRVHKAQATHAGAMISIRVDTAEAARNVINRVRVFSFAESLGGVESLITYPLTQTHAALPDEFKVRLGIDDRLLRLSVGIEAEADLRADLEEALR